MFKGNNLDAFLLCFIMFPARTLALFRYIKGNEEKECQNAGKSKTCEKIDCNSFGYLRVIYSKKFTLLFW